MTPARQQRPTLDDIIKELECQLGCSEMLFFDEDPKRHLDYTEEAYCELRDVCKQLILVLNASRSSTHTPAQPHPQDDKVSAFSIDFSQFDENANKWITQILLENRKLKKRCATHTSTPASADPEGTIFYIITEDMISKWKQKCIDVSRSCEECGYLRQGDCKFDRSIFIRHRKLPEGKFYSDAWLKEHDAAIRAGASP